MAHVVISEEVSLGTEKDGALASYLLSFDFHYHQTPFDWRKMTVKLNKFGPRPTYADIVCAVEHLKEIPSDARTANHVLCP